MICALIAAMAAGATRIDHVNVLRAGATQQALPFKMMATSTIGTFHRSFRMSWSITADHQTGPPHKGKAAIANISDDAWVDIDYTLSGDAQVAKTDLSRRGPFEEAPTQRDSSCGGLDLLTPPNKPCSLTGDITASSPSAAT
jgi:hypothetical protein